MIKTTTILSAMTALLAIMTLSGGIPMGLGFPALLITFGANFLLRAFGFKKLGKMSGFYVCLFLSILSFGFLLYTIVDFSMRFAG